MNRSLVFFAFLFTGCFVRAQDGYLDDEYSSSYGSVSTDSFGPALDPYGSWMVVPGYGRAWQPAVQYVGPSFYPYATGGRWLYTNAGWVFDSELPFGWAVFHYGRWYRDVTYGWLWLPGTTWGPSWVSWRAGGSYIGWAPLGPRGAPRYDYDRWCFVPTDRFTGGNVRRYSLDEREFHRAVAATQPLPSRGRSSAGPPPAYVSSVTRQRIVPVPLTQVPSARRVPPPASSRGRFDAPAGRGGRSSTPTPPRLEQPLPPPSMSPPARGAPQRMGQPLPPPSMSPPDRREPPPLQQPAPSFPRPERREQPQLGAPAPQQAPPSSPSNRYQRPNRRTTRSPSSPPPPPPPPPR